MLKIKDPNVSIRVIRREATSVRYFYGEVNRSPQGVFGQRVMVLIYSEHVTRVFSQSGDGGRRT